MPNNEDVKINSVTPVDQKISDESMGNLEGFLNEMKTNVELKELERSQALAQNEEFKITKAEPIQEHIDSIPEESKIVPMKRKSNIDLSAISIKIPKDKKDYLLLRKKRLETEATYQVVLPKSGYYAEMLKLSSIEIQNLALANQSNSKYVYRQKLLKLVYDKVANTSLGKISFTDFLHITAEIELNILLYGIYCMTYKDINDYNITCENCEKNYNLSVHNKNLLILDVNQDADTILSIKNIVTEAKTPEELTKQSFVANISRIELNNGDVYEIKEPSLYDSLDRLYKNIDEEKYKGDITLGFTKYINSINILDGDGEYLQFTEFDPVYTEFKALSDEDHYIVSECIKEISNKNRIRFGLRNITCPHCQHKTEDQIIDEMEMLVFLQHQSRMEKFRTKGTGSK
jgi:hypothetical protein